MALRWLLAPESRFRKKYPQIFPSKRNREELKERPIVSEVMLPFLHSLLRIIILLPWFYGLVMISDYYEKHYLAVIGIPVVILLFGWVEEPIRAFRRKHQKFYPSKRKKDRLKSNSIE